MKFKEKNYQYSAFSFQKKDIKEKFQTAKVNEVEYNCGLRILIDVETLFFTRPTFFYAMNIYEGVIGKYAQMRIRNGTNSVGRDDRQQNIMTLRMKKT